MTDAPEIKQNANGVYFLDGEQLWDSDILPVCLEHIKEGDTVIDAGAWIGGHTIAYAKKVGESGEVVAFEPNNAAYNCLVLNAGIKFQNVLCLNIALGDRGGSVGLEKKIGWYDSTHVVEGGGLEAVMDRVDNYDLKPNFIKIDVEGCELKVLKGAAKTIEKFRPKMVIEVNEPALQRQGTTRSEILFWMGYNGYETTIIEQDTTLDSLIYNVLCIPR